ncbi:MAG TPA: ArsA-related P-loop ATPase [bacterium]|nr:ArsA-related P-loop ATPase [bacterium]
MASLLDKRFLIFSGKGGVGKSTVAAAVAVAAARRGKRVLIVELGDQERMPSIFGAKKAGYDGAKIFGSDKGPIAPVWSMCLTARECLHEFVIRQVKFERLYEAVFENRVIRYFTAAAPGLDELVVMGKVENLSEERLERRKQKRENGGAGDYRFDLVVMDAPATGHGLAFFKVPKMTMAMVKMGPLYRKAEMMWNLITDPERTAFNVVTLPEEMPVNESLDLHAAAKDMGLPPGVVIVNGIYPKLFEKEESALLDDVRAKAKPAEGVPGIIASAALDAAISYRARRSLHEEMIGRVRDELKMPRFELPFLFRPTIGAEEIGILADQLEGI